MMINDSRISQNPYSGEVSLVKKSVSPNLGIHSSYNSKKISVQQQSDKFNTLIKTSNHNFSIQYDKDLELLKILIKDSDTDKVIRTIPTKEFIRMKLSLGVLIGNLINKKY